MDPEQARVNLSPINEENIYVKVATKGDMKKIVGKGGEYIRSIQNLLKFVNRRDGTNLEVTFTEPDEPTESFYPTAQFKNEWPRGPVAQLVADMATEIFDDRFSISVLEGGDFESLIEVELTPQGEDQAVIDLFNTSVLQMFRAIGMQEGRRLTVRAKFPTHYRKDAPRMEFQRW